MGNKRFDWVLLICIVILCSFGAAIMASVAPTLFVSQIVFYILGFGLFFLFSQVDYKIFPSISKQIYVISFLLLLITLFIGFESRGSTRWISILGFRLQFSEILKPFILASLAAFLANKDKLFFAIFLGLAPLLLIFKQPDLGSALVYGTGLAGVVFLSNISWMILITGSAVAAVLVPLSWHFLADYQKHRILSFINPQSDPLGTSYNAIQATIAIGSGGIFGWGLGRGTQSQLLFLPEHHTDFVFAALAEELGFVGAGLLLVVYFVLIWRAIKIALNASDSFGRVLAGSLAIMLFAQVFINVGMNLGIMPVTGITLPLVSYGGSSILSTMITLGIIENIALNAKV